MNHAALIDAVAVRLGLDHEGHHVVLVVLVGRGSVSPALVLRDHSDRSALGFLELLGRVSLCGLPGLHVDRPLIEQCGPVVADEAGIDVRPPFPLGEDFGVEIGLPVGGVVVGP